ncbi:hypothetical protein KXW54_005017, partial [Aspergillus fumigatus]
MDFAAAIDEASVRLCFCLTVIGQLHHLSPLSANCTITEPKVRPGDSWWRPAHGGFPL